MKIERINDWFARQGRWMVQKRWLVLSLFILVFAIGFTGLRYFKVSASWEDYFLEDDPMLVKTKEFKDIFGNDNFAAVLTQCDNSFMKENLELIRAGARVGIAHGKMTEEELNPVWQHLLNGEIDILVCTTLIETGIDVRNCNTLIIEDADRMGLAQLYQIRGRVGRSGRKAYAYFTFRRDKTLTDIAQKRLSAIREFTAFGSGFRIAMRDLQIRGAGSLLGHSQHGHMEAVGYDLYVKMLGQAIARAKGEPIQRDKSECLVDLRVDAFIPEKYIADGPGRIEAYKRIAAIQTPEDAADVLDELIDRYGDPPPSVSDLVNVSLVRVQAAAVGVYEVTQKKDTLLLQVETLDVAMIRGLLIAFNGRVTAGAGTKPYLSVTLQPDEKPLELLQSILKAMADILAAPPEENTGKK